MVNNNYFKHSSSIVSEKAIIGDGSNIWHFSHIREGAKIGKNEAAAGHFFFGAPQAKILKIGSL